MSRGYPERTLQSMPDDGDEMDVVWICECGHEDVDRFDTCPVCYGWNVTRYIDGTEVPE